MSELVIGILGLVVGLWLGVLLSRSKMAALQSALGEIESAARAPHALSKWALQDWALRHPRALQQPFPWRGEEEGA